MISFASQDLGIRFWAIFSSVTLAVLGFMAGAALLFVEHNVDAWGIATPGLFNAMSTLGVTTIALAWCLYMAVLGGAFGYRRTDFGDAVVFILFLVTAAYYCCALIASFLPFMHGTRSVM